MDTNKVKKDSIHSALGPVISLDLARQPMKAPAAIVAAHVLVPSSEYDNIHKNYPKIAHYEGGYITLINFDASRFSAPCGRLGTSRGLYGSI